jgi:hypothetical protein
MEHVPCFLVEWYRPELIEGPYEHAVTTLCACAKSMSAEGSPVELVSLLAIPNDDTLFGIFTADSASLIARTCDRAGMPAQRLTAAVSFPLLPTYR